MAKQPILPFLLLWLCALSAAAQTCHYGEGGSGLDADLKALHAEPSCQEAYELYRKCLWGSSADGPRADVVIGKCKAEFQQKLTPSQGDVLQAKLNLCQVEYGGMDGTLWLSEAGSCSLAVYVDFATNLAKAAQPIPRASFNCARAQTPLEHAVCSDVKLGQFDLLMAEAYKGFLGELKPQDKVKLIQNQRAWNASTPEACALSSPAHQTSTLGCLRERYRQRMQNLNQCAAGADVGCLTSTTPQ